MEPKRGFVTIATGDEKYYKLAVGLLHSYRNNYNGNNIPFGIICDRKNKFTDEFDDVVIIEKPNNSYMDKLLLYKYSPYDETIFIDSDSLILSDPNCLWNDFKDADDVSCYGVSLPLNSNKGWFSYENCGDWKNEIKFLIDLHGGLYYFRKSKRCEEIFKQAITLSSEYTKYKFKNFDKPADEPLLAFAMAIHQCQPYEGDMRLIFVPSYRGRLKINIKGELSIKGDNNGKKSSDEKIAICHFATPNTRLFIYKYLVFLCEQKYLNGEVKSSLTSYLKIRIMTAPQNIKATLRHTAGQILRKIL